MTIRILGISALLALAFGPSCGTGGTSADTAGDNYWQITFEPNFAKSDKSQQFWRTHQAATNVEVFFACDPDTAPPIATAVGNEDGTWSISGTFGDLVATVPTPGVLTVTQGGQPFASGQRIAKPTCENGFPLSITYVTPTEGERSFANITGDALHVEAARNVALPTLRSPAPIVASVPDSTTPLPNGDKLACRTNANPLSVTRSLSGVPTLGPNSAIWPGALLQGKDYAQGKFTPISIARAGSTITMTGVNFGGNGTSSRKIATMTKANVTNGIASLLQQNILSAEANVAYRASAIYNNDQMAYAAGVDGRFLNGLDNLIKIDPNSGRNYVLFQFLQSYYTVSMEDPETAYSVFQAGTDLKDPENQIGADNPPLYVRDVSYGRMILFLASSNYDSNAVAEALNAAADGKSGGASISGGVSVPHETILQNSTISYFVIGGDAIATLGSIGTIGGISNIYEALKNAITTAKLAQLSQFSKGVPISYSLSYLTSRAPASLGFATDFNVKSCTVVPRQVSSFSLSILGVDNNANVTISDENGQNERTVYTGGNTPDYRASPLDFFMPNVDQTYILQLILNNDAGPSGLDFQLTRRSYDPSTFTGLDNRTGTMVEIGPVPRIFPPPPPYPVVHIGGSWNIGEVARYRIRLNRGNGEVTVIQGR